MIVSLVTCLMVELRLYSHLQLCEEILAVLNHLREPDTRQGSSTDLPHMSAQTVFSVLDHLNKCLRQRLQLLLPKNSAAHRAKCNMGMQHRII